MPLLAAADYAPPPVYVASAQDGDDQFGDVFATDATRIDLPKLSVAGCKYPLRRVCRASFIPVVGEFLVEEFSGFVGRGGRLDEAQEDWAIQVHVSFQKLLHKRPFEMTAVEKKEWGILSSNIDVAMYRNHVPFKVVQFGRISKALKTGAGYNYPSQIQWDNGSREDIELSQVDADDFITYQPGQPFEAVVTRDPVSFKLIRIIHIKRRPEPQQMSTSEEAELLKSIGSSNALPECDWD